MIRKAKLKVKGKVKLKLKVVKLKALVLVSYLEVSGKLLIVTVSYHSHNDRYYY